MKSFHNIDRCRRAGEHHTGYSADGRSWRIVGRSGYWSAYANVTAQGHLNTLIGFDRLSDISKELEKVGK